MKYKVGDILVSTWGYEARLATFWKVLKVTAKTVKIAKITANIKTGDWWAGADVPDLNSPLGRTENPRIRPNSDYLKTKDYGLAYLWDGKPVSTYNHH